MKNSQVMTDVLLTVSEKRKNLKRFYESLEKKDGKLNHKGRTDTTPKVVTTPGDVDECFTKSMLVIWEASKGL